MTFRYSFDKFIKISWSFILSKAPDSSQDSGPVLLKLQYKRAFAFNSDHSWGVCLWESIVPSTLVFASYGKYSSFLLLII